MSRHLSRGGDGDPELAAALDDVVAGYEVDRARVMARLRAGGAGRTGLPTHGGPSRSLAGLRRTGPLLSAAAVASVLVGVGLGLQVHDRPDPANSSQPRPTTAAPTAADTTSPPPAPTGSPTGSTSPSATLTLTGSPTATGSGRPAGPSGSAAATSTPQAPGQSTTTSARPSQPGGGSATDPSSLQVVGFPARLVLGSGHRDWLITGARSDGTVVRDKRGSGALAVSVLAGKPVVRPAPLLLDWSGGLPEQDHTGAGSWWCADNGGADDAAVFRVRVDALPPGASLVVATGVAGSGGASTVKVEARVDGGKLAQLRTAGGMLRIAPPAAAVGRGMTVEFTPSPGGLPAGKVCLSAAVLG